MEAIFKEADRMKVCGLTCCEGKILASIFFEPSTRTRFSFESAMYRLGGAVISAENAREFSSSSKGETIEDMINVVSSYADAIVLRHFEEGAAARAAKVATVPIINAGDGIGQHPTQALVDLYTIQKEHGSIDGITVAVVGDLKNGRTIKSLLWGLSKFNNIKVHLISPQGLKVQTEFLDELKKTSLTILESEDLESIASDVDVLYQTRIQKERFADESEYQKFKSCYHIDLKIMSTMKKDGLLMHPLPRVDEIDTEVDNLPQAAFFKQAKNGVFVRMALLKWVLED